MRRSREYTEKRQTIPFYRNWLLSATMLPEKDLGKLIKCVTGYLETGERPKELEDCNNLAVRLCFENFVVADDQNFKKFIARCETNKKNRNAQKESLNDNDTE